MLKEKLCRALMIRPGEGRLMLYLSGVFLVFGLGLALGRGSSDAVFFKRFGVEYLPQMFFATSVLLMLFSLAYAEFADRWRPGRMLQVMCGIVVALLLVDWLFMRGEAAAYSYVAYYLIYALASEILLVHVAFYANSFLDSQQGKRLFPLVNAASRMGAILGGLSLGLLASLWPAPNIALVWAASLLVLLLAIRLYHRRTPEVGQGRPRRKSGRRFSGVREGLYFARRSTLLKVSGWGMFLLMILVCLQDYLTSTLLSRHYEKEQDLAAFFGWFFAVSNALVLTLQLSLTSRLLRRFGLRTVNLIYPVSTVLSFAALAVAPGFLAAVLGRFNYMGMLPAFRIPAANLFYNALPTYMQGRARALMVGMVLPAGLAVSGILLMLVPRDWVGRGLAIVGVVLAVLFLLIKLRKNTAYGDSLADLIRQQVFSDNIDPIERGLRLDDEVAARLAGEIARAPDDATAIAYAGFLRQFAPERAGELLLSAAPRANIRVQDRLLRLLAELDAEGWRDYALGLMREQPDRHAKATALALLGNAGDPEALRLALEWVKDDNPRLRATAASLLVHAGDPAGRELGLGCLRDMLASPLHGENVAALSALGGSDVAGLAAEVEALLASPDGRVRAAALGAHLDCRRRRGEDCAADLVAAARDDSARVRVVVARRLTAVDDPPARLDLLGRLLSDMDPDVRRAAQESAAQALALDLHALEAGMAAHFSDFRLFQQLIQATRALDAVEREPLARSMAARHQKAATDKRELAGRIAGEPGDATAWVVRQTLREEAEWHVDMVLALLAVTRQGETIPRLVPALRSADRRLRAQGLESLQCMLQGEQATALIRLIEDERAPARPAREVHEALWRRVSQESTPWLRECMAAYSEGKA